MSPAGKFIWRSSDAPPRPGLAIGFACLVLGLEMMLQPQRFSRTPAYGNLTAILDIRVWGFAHLVAAALFFSYIYLELDRIPAVVIHLLAGSLLVWWFLAFLVRRGTDASTTAVTVVAWGTFLYLVVWSMRTVPKIEGRLPRETSDS